MKPQAMLDELENAAEQISVKVSYEPLAASVGHGGLCRVKQQYRVIIDKRASVHERVATLAQGLARLDLSDVFLSPKVRELVDYYGRRHRQRAAERSVDQASDRATERPIARPIDRAS